MSSAGGGEKSEKATPKKKQKARREGQIGNSPEFGQWLGMLAATFVIPKVFGNLLEAARQALVQAGFIIRTPDTGKAISVFLQAAGSAVRAVLPLAVLIAFVGVASAVLQGNVWFAPKQWVPKFKRLNPLSGVKRIFGPQAAWQLTKSALKCAALAAVVYFSVRKLIPTVYGSGSLPLSELIRICLGTALNVLRYAAVAGLLMAVADYAVVRKRNNKSLKMSKQEVKEEHKSSEGDPLIRGQRRARAMAMSRNRMMAEVMTADVVLVNPTHVAVALRYDPDRGAPRVVAKGADHLAARIRTLAEENRVPMVRDVPLARTLYQSCEVGQEIPAELYQAVATVLAFIMTLSRRGSTAGIHTVRPLQTA